MITQQFKKSSIALALVLGLGNSGLVAAAPPSQDTTIAPAKKPNTLFTRETAKNVVVAVSAFVLSIGGYLYLTSSSSSQGGNGGAAPGDTQRDFTQAPAKPYSCYGPERGYTPGNALAPDVIRRSNLIAGFWDNR